MFVLFVFLLGCYCSNFGYILMAKKSICLTENLGRHDLFLFNVSSSSPQYIFKVEKQIGRNYEQIHSNQDALLNAYSLVVEEKSVIIRFCAISKSEESITIEFNHLTGTEVTDQGNIAKRQDLDGVEFELQRLESLNKDISREKVFLIEKETSRNELQHDISNKVIGFSLFSFGILFIVSFCNIHQIKKILIKKKIV